MLYESPFESSLIVSLGFVWTKKLTTVIHEFFINRGYECSSWFTLANLLHVVIFRFSFIDLRRILQIPLKWWVNFQNSWASTGYFSNSTSSSVTSHWFSPFIRPLFVKALSNSYATQVPTLLMRVFRRLQADLKSEARYVGVIWSILHVLQLLPIRFR